MQLRSGSQTKSVLKNEKKMGAKQSRIEEVNREGEEPVIIAEDEDESESSSILGNATVQILLKNVSVSQFGVREQTPQTTITMIQKVWRVLSFVSSLIGFFGGGFTIYTLVMQHINAPNEPINNNNNCDDHVKSKLMEMLIEMEKKMK